MRNAGRQERTGDAVATTLARNLYRVSAIFQRNRRLSENAGKTGPILRLDQEHDVRRSPPKHLDRSRAGTAFAHVQTSAAGPVYGAI